MKNYLIILFFLCYTLVTAQVKIGDNPQAIDLFSLLELESNSKALVITRVSESEMLAITPLQGAIVYNTDASCVFYYDGATWNNLCSGGTSNGSIAWGDITGDITTQTDLDFVDRSTMQDNIAGEKTFTNKFTVDTGDTSAQIAEFLGRVKGEDAIDQEEFVTKAQLDGASGTVSGTEGSIFFANSTGSPIDNNDNLFWDNTNNQLRVGNNIDRIQINSLFSDDTTTLNIQGSISKPIDNATTLTEEHHTIIINWASGYIKLPNPNTCYGRIYIIKINSSGSPVPVFGNSGFWNTESVNVFQFEDKTVTQIQSTGYRWEQIN